ncbi:3-alpha-hydroxysteroid dehydrogenase/carbonyl reductase [Colletotrichum sp. SAR11_59]|nr:3-alpha-hydroxysteroid dehydrogenase/carbonyl reductase [Colletotrichum sp. SAR11_59]
MQSSNVVVVIGCGGKGLPCARRLGIGRQVLLADVSADRLSIAATALVDEGYFIHTALVDISSFDSVNELAQKAFVIGPVETIILAAGVGPAADCARTVYEIDLLGTINVIDAILPIVQAGSNFVYIVNAVAFLVNPASCFITGTDILVDGGIVSSMRWDTE